MLVVFSGGSGVGKNTVINKLLLDGRYDLMPTYTTRQRRENETTGKPYYFISKEEFLKKIDSGELYEYNIVHGNYYGSSKMLYEEKSKSGKILLKDIDVMGTQNLVNSLGKSVQMLTFFFRVDSKEILVERLRERNEKEIDKRLERYDLEQTYQNKYDYIITNNELEETVNLCGDIIDYSIEKKSLKSTKALKFISKDKIENMARLMRDEDELFEPINAAVINREIYIIDGHHRYLASIVAKKRIAVKIVNVQGVAECDQKKWEDIIAENK